MESLCFDNSGTFFERSSFTNQRLFGDFLSYYAGDAGDDVAGLLLFGDTLGNIHAIDRDTLLNGDPCKKVSFSWQSGDDNPITSVEAKSFGNNLVGVISSSGLARQFHDDDDEEEEERVKDERASAKIKLWKLCT